MKFIHRQVLRDPVHLTSAGIDDFEIAIGIAATFEQRQLTPAIDIEIIERISHAVDVADLTCQVEEDVFVRHQIAKAIRIPHVREVDRHSMAHWSDVIEGRAVSGNHRIHERHICSQINQSYRKIASQKPNPPVTKTLLPS